MATRGPGGPARAGVHLLRNDLEAEGFITTVGGKGCYVSSVEPSAIREGHLVSIQENIRKAAEEAKQNGITLEELHEIVDLMYDGD